MRIFIAIDMYGAIFGMIMARLQIDKSCHF